MLTDRFEKRYVAAVDVTSVKLLETGPLRMTYRLTGHHRALEPSKELPAFHDFSVVVSLIANCSLARVEWTLENGSLLEPTGPLAFHSYELLAATGLPAAATPDAEDAGLAADAADATDGADETAPTEATPKGKGGKGGDKPKGPSCGVDVPGKASKGDVAFALRQDGPAPARFEYVLDGANLPANDGDLWGGVRCGKEGVWVHRADSAHNHPASLAHEPGGPLVIGLLPASADTEFWLDDATQKTFRLDVVRDSTGKGRETIAHAAQPARVLVDATDIANSLAWGDTGSFYVPDASEMREPVKLPKDPATGWVDWGEFSSKSTHETGSPRNKLSVYLEALQSGRADLYDLAQARAWHAMDLRPFHIEGFSADKYPMANLNEGTPHENEPARNRLGRSGMASRLTEWKTGIPARGHGYNGFDPEHMTLDDIYECWLLTGDWVAHDALVSAGEAMLTWKSVVKDGELHTARTTGWTLRALVQVFRATGDRRYLDAAADMVERADRMRGHGAVKYFHRNKKDPRHIADRESESAWMVAVGIRGLAAYWTETHDAKVPPMLRDLVDFIMASYRGNGFADDLPCDGPLTGGTVAAPLGVSQWIPGALADAAFITGNHEPVDAVYPYYRQMVEHPGYELRFGATSWHWWQSYLVSLQQRYGTVAVQSPSHFRMPERATH